MFVAQRDTRDKDLSRFQPPHNWCGAHAPRARRRHLRQRLARIDCSTAPGAELFTYDRTEHGADPLWPLPRGIFSFALGAGVRDYQMFLPGARPSRTSVWTLHGMILSLEMPL